MRKWWMPIAALFFAFISIPSTQGTDELPFDDYDLSWNLVSTDYAGLQLKANEDGTYFYLYSRDYMHSISLSSEESAEIGQILILAKDAREAQKTRPGWKPVKHKTQNCEVEFMSDSSSGFRVSVKKGDFTNYVVFGAIDAEKIGKVMLSAKQLEAELKSRIDKMLK